MFVNGSEMNTTITNVVDDCRDRVHFSRKLIESYWPTFDDNVKQMMDMLSGNIYNQFIDSIRIINIRQTLNLLDQFGSQVNGSNIMVIVRKVSTELNTT